MVEVEETGIEIEGEARSWATESVSGIFSVTGARQEKEYGVSVSTIEADLPAVISTEPNVSIVAKEVENGAIMIFGREINLQPA